VDLVNGVVIVLVFLIVILVNFGFCIDEPGDTVSV
jgi:hypothetical protein